MKEEKKMVKSFERSEKREWSVEDKAEAIKSSKMPEAQKQAYLQDIGAMPKVEQQGIPFTVYAKIRKIDKYRMSAMLAYPKAKGTRLATLQEWDEIFKNF